MYFIIFPSFFPGRHEIRPIFQGNDVYTTRESERLLRLPMFYNLDMESVKYVTDTVLAF